jgi:hypothetical protein
MKKSLCNQLFIVALVVLIACISFIHTVGASNQNDTLNNCPPGDINQDCQVGLEEAIIALQVLAGFSNQSSVKNDKITDPSVQASENDIDLSSIVSLINHINFSEQDFVPFVRSMINTMVLPCGQLHVNNFYPFDASFQLNGAQECLGVTGTIALKSHIFDTKAYLTFDQLSYEGLTVNGNAIATIKPQDCGYMATISSESFTVVGHKLSGFLFATHSDQSDKELLVGLKGTDTFTFGDNQILLEGDLTYSHKGGANGTAKAIINDKVILITFDSVVIDLAKLVPISGVMKINDGAIDFGKNE